MKALLIHHKRAGNGAASPKALAAAIRAAGWKVRTLARKKADADAIAKPEADLIVIAGGDGTVAAILAMLPDRSVPVAILPTGTANNIAGSLGIEGEPEALVAQWDFGRRRRFDIGEAQGPWGCRCFAEGVGVGAFADSLRLVRDADGAEKLRAGRQALRAALAAAAPLPLAVELDGSALSEDLLMAEILNVAAVGPRLALAPEADPGDGRLHAAFLREPKRRAMLDWLDAGGAGEPPVERRAGTEARVLGGGATMRIDDEWRRLEVGAEVTVRLEGEPVQILAPAEGPALAG